MLHPNAPVASTRPSSIAAERVFRGGGFAPATLRLQDGMIVAIDPFDPAADVVLPAGAVLLPGLVDSHVHLNDPGRVEWEGFESGTAAAVAGGVTTVLDMPLNSIPVTTTPAALAAKRAAAEGVLAVDVGFWGGAVPENLGTLAALHDAGVIGFKCFLSPSGIDEFGHLDAAQLEAALVEIAAFDGLMIVHAEDPTHLHPHGALGPRYADFLQTRPAHSERAAIGTVIAAAARTGARVHIVHVSDGTALPDVRAAKAAGVRITIETCPHYLTLEADQVPDAAAEFKCCPPIRDAANQDLLWDGVRDGTIDAIVSDHSPSTRELKGGGDFGTAWGGISGVQTGLRAVWTQARRRGIALEELVPLMTAGPARLTGLTHLGRIAVGVPAHLTVFEPERERVLAEAELAYRTPMSPWLGQSLSGVIAQTYLHGALVHTDADGLVARVGRAVLPAHAAPTVERTRGVEFAAARNEGVPA